VPPGTQSGDTTHDLPPGTLTGPGATPGGDNREDDISDDELVDDDDGGTGGATCITDPDTGAQVCE
jgi:hypothetical protein